MEYFKEAINLKELFVQIVAFITVFWVLKIFAWNKLLGFLEARRKKIQSDFEKIEQAQKTIEELRAEYNAKIQHIEDEAHKRLQEALADGKRLGRDIQDEARRNAQSILEKAKDDIQMEIQKAQETLKDQIAGLTMAATERLLQKKLDEKQDRELVENFIREIEKTP